MLESIKSLKWHLFGDGTSEENQQLLSEINTSNLKSIPEDKYNVVYWIYFIYGVAMLLPWNVFITASEFFAKRFAETEYKESFQNYFSTYSTISNFLTFVIVLWAQNKSQLQVDSFIPIMINTVVFSTMAITVETDFKGEDYFWFVLFFMVLTGGTTSFFQNAAFSEASRLPPIYVQAVLSGQGIAGVVVAISSIISAFAGTSGDLPNGVSTSRAAFLYFLSALLITVAALIGRMIVAQSPFYTYYMTKSPVDNESDEEEQEIVTVAEVIRKSYGHIFSIVYVFVITLMLFPSLTSLIKSVRRPNKNGRFFEDDVFVAFHFLLFNVGDWVGRMMPLSKHLQVFHVKSLIGLSLVRTVFVPLFLVCNVVISKERYLPVIIQSDFIYFLIVWFFAVSNGWAGSLIMMAAPQQESIKSGAEKAMVGSVMSFSLVLGLAIGGTLSFGIKSMI
ncbi:nucleoside transporter-domain-containing protein [Sporodiniella umbellata]|nr:nucleoside transporter-domain-containing protein [Sporodiniella umbellata]